MLVKKLPLDRSNYVLKWRKLNENAFCKNVNGFSLKSRVPYVPFMKIYVPILILKLVRLPEESIFSSKELVCKC